MGSNTEFVMTVAITMNTNHTVGNDVADIFLRDFPFAFRPRFYPAHISRSPTC